MKLHDLLFGSLLALIGLGIGLQIEAQLTQPKTHLLVLHDKSFVEGDSLTYNDLGQRPFFKLNGKTYESGEVRMFRNNNGYFAHLGFVDGGGLDTYAMRIKRGAIELYERVDIDIYSGEGLNIGPDDGYFRQRKLASGAKFQFYSVTDQDVKKANYKNLKEDLRGNPGSLNSLQIYRQYQWLQRGMITVGAGLLAGGLMMQSGSKKLSPLMALGIVLGGGSIICEIPKSDYKWLAVEQFNEDLVFDDY